MILKWKDAKKKRFLTLILLDHEGWWERWKVTKMKWKKEREFAWCIFSDRLGLKNQKRPESVKNWSDQKIVEVSKINLIGLSLKVYENSVS